MIRDFLEDYGLAALIVFLVMGLGFWAFESSSNRYFSLCMQQPGATHSYCEMKQMEYNARSGSSR